jgi:hypothetical protein
MLDILGGIALTAGMMLCVGTLALAGAGEGSWRARFAAIGVAWFAIVTALAAAGVFSRAGRFGILPLGAAIVVPIVAAQMVLARSRQARYFASGIPLPVLVAVHVGRLIGGFFLALYAAGRLPETFAMSAGYGDIFVGITALPLAWAIQRRVRGWQAMTLAWNAVAAFDLISAVSLGVGSAANSPLRFIFETPDSRTVGTLPWALIPGVAVPLYMITHIAIFTRLAEHAREEEDLTVSHAA